MAILRCSLEMQISKTRFPSDSALTGFATVERVISVIAAQGQDRPGKIGVWIPKTKVGNVSSLCFQGLTGRSNSETRAETKKKQLGRNSGNSGKTRRLEYHWVGFKRESNGEQTEIQIQR